MIEKNGTIWSCTNCGKTAVRQYAIKRHIESVHLRRRQYSCPDCNKSYTTRTILNAHYRSHTGERPYLCPTCERTFCRYATLAKHKTTHVKKQPFICTLCDKSIIRSCDLTKHITRYHSSESTQTHKSKLHVMERADL